MSETRSDLKIEENTLLSSVLCKFNKVYIIDKFIETPPEKHKSVSRNSKPYVIQQAIETLRKKFCDLDDLILHLHLLYIRTQKFKRHYSVLEIQNARRLAKDNLTSEKIDASFKKYFTKHEIECSVRSEITGDCVSTVLQLGTKVFEPLFCLANKQLSLISVTNLNNKKTNEISFILKGIKKAFKGSDIKVLTQFYSNAHEIYNWTRERWEKLLSESVNKRTTEKDESFLNAKDDRISKESEDNEHNKKVKKTSHDVNDLCARTDTHPGPSECCQTEFEEELENNEQCAKTKTRSPRKLKKHKINENLRNSKQHYPSIDQTIVPNKRCKDVQEQQPQSYNQRAKRYSRRLKDIKNEDDDRCKSHKPQSNGAESLQIQNVQHFKNNEQYVKTKTKSPTERHKEHENMEILKNNRHNGSTGSKKGLEMKQKTRKYYAYHAKLKNKKLKEAQNEEIEKEEEYENNVSFFNSKEISPNKRLKERKDVESLKNNELYHCVETSIVPNNKAKNNPKEHSQHQCQRAKVCKEIQSESQQIEDQGDFENIVTTKSKSPIKRPKKHENVACLKNNKPCDSNIVPSKKRKKIKQKHIQSDCGIAEEHNRSKILQNEDNFLHTEPSMHSHGANRKCKESRNKNYFQCADLRTTSNIQGSEQNYEETNSEMDELPAITELNYTIKDQRDYENIGTTKSKSPTKRSKKHENVACLKNNKRRDSNIVPNKKRKEFEQKHIQSGCGRAEEHNRSKKLQNEDNFLHTEPSIHSQAANRKCKEGRNKNYFQCADLGTTSNIQGSEQNVEEANSEMDVLPAITELNYTAAIRLNTQESPLLLTTTLKGENILKGFDELIRLGIADAPLPDYLYLEPRTGKTDFFLV